MRYYFVAIAIAASFPSGVAAYGVDTHAYLTAEAVDLYNNNFPDKNVSKDLQQFLIEGARHEDVHPRWMNHFYDPVYKRGLTYDPAIDAGPAAQFVRWGRWSASKDWVKDPAAQKRIVYAVVPAIFGEPGSRSASILSATQWDKLGLSLGEVDFTWQRAIRHYVRGEKDKAMFILGHTLHLMEDMSVPDHTRNDPHPDSPYEYWTLRFNAKSSDPALRSRLAGKAPILFDSLDEHFDDLAVFSNNNFYSKDTIGIQSGYSLPHSKDFELRNGFYYATENYEGVARHLYLRKSRSGSFLLNSKYDTTLQDEIVLEDYWSILSTKAVQHTAGVIKLFLDEAERAANDPNFEQEEPMTKLGQAIDTASRLIVEVGDGIARTKDYIVSSITKDSAPVDRPDLAGHPHLKEVIAPTNVAPKIVKPAPAAKDDERVVDTASVTLIEPEKDGKRSSALVENINTTSTVFAEDIESATPPLYGGGGSGSISGGGGGASKLASEPQPVSIPEVVSEPGPEPDNSSSTPPELPTIPELPEISARFDPADMRMIFEWAAAPDMYYAIDDVSASGTIRIWEGTDNSHAFQVEEVGRPYHYLWTVIDGDGLENSREIEVVAPHIAEAYFYTLPAGSSTRVMLELRYGESQFVPDVWSRSQNLWQGVAAYLDRDPNPSNNTLVGGQSRAPSDPEGMLRIGHENGEVAVFGLRPDICVSFGADDISRHCTLLPQEDRRIELDVQTDILDPADRHYLTLAFYDFDSDYHGPLRMAAIDKTRVYLSSGSPSGLPPAAPADLELSFDKFDGRADLSWATSTDPDSIDERITYEWTLASSTVAGDLSENDLMGSNWDSLGVSYGGGVGTHVSFLPRLHERYLIGVRARDDHGRVSEISTLAWEIPEGHTPYTLSAAQNTVSQDFKINTSSEISSLKLFTSRANLSGPNVDVYVCAVDIYEITAEGPIFIARNNHPYPGGGVSGQYEVRGHDCGARPTLTFPSGIRLEGGRTYRWKFSILSPGSVPFYGRAEDVAGGSFSGGDIVNAIFTLSGPNGVILDTQ